MRAHDGGATELGDAVDDGSGAAGSVSAATTTSPTRHPELLSRAAEPNHIVQFYDDDGLLCDAVAHFVGAGLARDEPVCVVATAAHRRELVARLARDGVDVERAGGRGRLVWLDAEETLAHILVRGMPDRTRFSRLFGDVLEKCRTTPATCVRAYGEMVDVLWRAGNRQAALELERMWNDLARHHAISLLCAYIMGNFYRSDDADSFKEVCRAHSHVVPAASMGSLTVDSDEQRRIISELQQRALALESELEQRKQLEAALREALLREKDARGEAEQSARFNEMFAGMLGHDLRNPLSAITTGALYIARLDVSPKSSKAATRILSSAERMARMIDQLLDFTRIRVGGGLALSPVRVDLLEVLGKLKDDLEAANPERAIRVEAQGGCVGEWDRDRLVQVLSNLVGNAVHHGLPGEPVTVQCDGTAADAITMTIHNGGPVAPTILPVLFEPFRGVARSQRTRGLGLGLFVTQHIIQAHGGSIEVTSDAVDGTRFTVTLPRKAPPRPEPITSAGE